jgi:preprotein translocase subunit SecD
MMTLGILALFTNIVFASEGAKCIGNQISTKIGFSVSHKKIQNGRVLNFENKSYIVNAQPDISYRDIESIELTEDSAPIGIKQRVFSFSLTDSGTKKLETLTQNNVRNTIVVHVGDTVLAVPVITSAISDGRFIFSPPQFSGKNFSLRDFCLKL